MTETGWLGTLSLLGPVATGAAALVALAVGIATIRQRDRADRREQWWRRAEWALGLTLSGDEEAVRRGYAVLDHLVRSDLATDDERGLLRAASELGLNTPDLPPHDGRGAPRADDGGEVSGGPVRPGDRGPGASP